MTILASSTALQAQQRLTATELSVGVASAMARRTFIGAEVGVATRPGVQSRAAVAVAGGSTAGRPGLRAQVTLQFLVTPAARRGIGLYAGVGGAFSARRHAHSAGFLAIVLGLEAAPGRRRGWRNYYVEVGLGGGVRAAAGWRLRWFPRWWR